MFSINKFYPNCKTFNIEISSSLNFFSININIIDIHIGYNFSVLYPTYTSDLNVYNDNRLWFLRYPHGYVLGVGVMIVMFFMFKTNRFFYENFLIH